MDSDEEAAQTTADFVRNNKERRSRLDDVSFGDDGKTRDSAGAARASDRVFEGYHIRIYIESSG